MSFLFVSKGEKRQCLEQLGHMNVEEWKMVATLCTFLMVAGLWSLHSLSLATSSVALNRSNLLCHYDVTYFDSPVYV